MRKLDRWALLLDGCGMDVLAAFTPALVFLWGHFRRMGDENENDGVG